MKTLKTLNIFVHICVYAASRYICYMCVCVYVCVLMCVIKIRGKMDKSDTYKGFSSDISFFIQIISSD